MENSAIKYNKTYLCIKSTIRHIYALKKRFIETTKTVCQSYSILDTSTHRNMELFKIKDKYGNIYIRVYIYI